MLHSKRESAIQIIHLSCNSGLCTPRGTVVQRFPSHQTKISRTTFLHCVEPSYGCWPMRRPEPSQPDSGLFHQCPDPPGASLSQWLLTRPASWTLLRRERRHRRKRASPPRCGPPRLRWPCLLARSEPPVYQWHMLGRCREEQLQSNRLGEKQIVPHNSYYWFVPSRGLPLRHPNRRLRLRPHTRTQRQKMLLRTLRYFQWKVVRKVQPSHELQ